MTHRFGTVAATRERFVAADVDAERLQASLVHDLTSLLNPRGYVLVARGPAGVSFRRERRPEFWGGLALVLVGLPFALIPVWWIAAPLLAAGAAMAVLRRPGTVTVELRSGADREVTVTVVGARERGLVALLARHRAADAAHE